MGTRAADRIEPLVEHLGDMLDTIEDEMMSERDDDDAREQLTRLRRSLINLRRLLWPQRDVLNTLEIEDLSFLTARDRARLQGSLGPQRAARRRAAGARRARRADPRADPRHPRRADEQDHPAC